MGAQAAFQNRAMDPEALASTHRGRVPMGSQETLTLGEHSHECSPFTLTHEIQNKYK